MEGGLREVAYEFGWRIPHGGGDRDSGGVGMGWVVIVVLLFLWLAVLVRVHSDSTLFIPLEQACESNRPTKFFFALDVSGLRAGAPKTVRGSNKVSSLSTLITTK